MSKFQVIDLGLPFIEDILLNLNSSVQLRVKDNSDQFLNGAQQS